MLTDSVLMWGWRGGLETTSRVTQPGGGDVSDCMMSAFTEERREPVTPITRVDVHSVPGHVSRVHRNRSGAW